jgi:hypothetical protein
VSPPHRCRSSRCWRPAGQVRTLRRFSQSGNRRSPASHAKRTHCGTARNRSLRRPGARSGSWRPRARTAPASQPSSVAASQAADGAPGGLAAGLLGRLQVLDAAPAVEAVVALHAVALAGQQYAGSGRNCVPELRPRKPFELPYTARPRPASKAAPSELLMPSSLAAGVFAGQGAGDRGFRVDGRRVPQVEVGKRRASRSGSANPLQESSWVNRAMSSACRRRTRSIRG